MQINMQNLFEIFGFYGALNLPKPESINLAEPILSSQQFEELPSHVQEVYLTLFNDQKKNIKFNEILPLKKIRTAMPLCNKILHEHEPIFRCLDCIIHPAAVLCVSCFENGDHSNHRHVKIPAGGGNCDCGNLEALKKEAFCKNHNGQAAKILQIPEKEERIFMEYAINITGWLCVLFHRKLKKETNMLGDSFFLFLNDLNESSLYYNSLTFKYLLQKLPNLQALSQAHSIKNISIMDFIFHLEYEKHTPVMKTINRLYFNMFSLNEFKLQISRAFVRAYNSVKNFESSEFHALYIQLFANSHIVLQLIKNKEALLMPTKSNYNECRFISDLNFLTSIEEKAALAYLEQFFKTFKIIPLKYLDEIQESLESTQLSQTSMHLVDCVTNYLEEENLFIITMEEVIALFLTWNRQQMINQLLMNVFRLLQSHKHSYKKNKAILPYHRLFSILLYTYLSGKIENMASKEVILKLCQILDITLQHFAIFLRECFEKVASCLLEFSETYAKRNYFQNYLPLYVRRGKKVINNDFLLFKECLIFFTQFPEDNSAQQTFSAYPQEVIASLYKSDENQAQNTTKTQFIHKWIVFESIMAEAVISRVPEIIENIKLSLNNEEIIKYRKYLFERILKASGPILKQQVLEIEMYFVGKLEDSALGESASFNKATRKYELIQKQKIEPINLDYFPSRAKVTLNFNKVNSLTQNRPPQINTFEIEAVSSLFNNKFISSLFEVIKTDISDLKEMEMLCRLMKDFLKRLEVLIALNLQKAKNKDELFNLKNFLQELSSQIASFIDSSASTGISHQKSSQEKALEDLKQKTRLKRQRIRQKFQKNAKKVLEKNQEAVKENEEQLKDMIDENEQKKICMICRDPSSQDSIYYIANLQTTRLINQKIGIIENLIFPKSCLHSAHYKCCKKIYGNNFAFKCPLCKSSSNIMLPVPGLADEDSKKEMLKRVSFITQTKSPIPELVKLEIPQVQNSKVFWEILKCFGQMIGMNGILDSVNFEKTRKTLAHCLYIIIYDFWKNQLSNTDQIQFNLIISEYKRIHYEEQKNKPGFIALLQIKLWCIDVIFQSLSHPISIQYILNRYSSTINKEDLQQLIKNIYLTIDPEKEPQIPELNFESQVPPISTFFLNNYFNPPLTAVELFELKKENSKLCKNGHNIIICVTCCEKFCYDCPDAQKHAEEVHANNCLSFSLFTGNIIYFGNQGRLKTKSLYENTIGMSWTMQKEPDQYTLNKQLYHNSVSSYFKQNLYEYLRKTIHKDLQVINSTHQGALNFLEQIQ